MKPWRKVTRDWPHRVSSLFWAVMAGALREAGRKLTIRRVIYAAALLLAVIAFAQMVSVDLAFFLAGDVAFYLELTTVVYFIAAQGRLRQLFSLAQRRLRLLARRHRLPLARFTRNRRRPRLPRPMDTGKPGGSADDEPAAWGLAFA